MKKLLLLSVALAAAGLIRAAITPVDSTNNAGFISVSVPGNSLSNVLNIISVPFEQCLGNGSAGMLSDLLSTNGLIAHATDPASSDQLVVLTTNTSGQAIYYYYWFKSNVGWATNNTTILSGTVTNITSPDATNFPLARGLGFWIKRPIGAVATNVVMKGQIPSASQPLTIKSGLTLLGMGALGATNLNAASAWGTRCAGSGLSGMDKLIVVKNDGAGAMTYYYYHATPTPGWYTHYPETPGPTLTNVTIEPGYGFWYFTTNATTFTPVVP